MVQRSISQQLQVLYWGLRGSSQKMGKQIAFDCNLDCCVVHMFSVHYVGQNMAKQPLVIVDFHFR